MPAERSPFSFVVGEHHQSQQEHRHDVVLSETLDPDPDLLVSDPESEIGDSTRKIARPEFIPHNSRDAIAKVKLTLMHQRRGNKVAAEQQPWRDADSFKLSDLKAGQQVRMELDSTETKRLFQGLLHWYQRMGTLEEVLEEAGVRGTTDLSARFVSGRGSEVLAGFLEREGGERAFELLDALQPGLTKTMSIRKQHEERELALKEFRAEMELGNWDEGDWQRYFEWNPWIFGYGLSYRFLDQIENQPHYGGTEVSGKGAERGDFLLATDAAVKFTVLVEIKKPGTKLLHTKPYRSYYHVSQELAGGLAQLHSNCERWLVEGSTQKDTFRRLERESTYVHWPRGILVIGHSSELDDPNKAGAFERLRQTLHNPEIVTFDELLARAEHLVQTDFDISNTRSDQVDEENSGLEPPF